MVPANASFVVTGVVLGPGGPCYNGWPLSEGLCTPQDPIWKQYQRISPFLFTSFGQGMTLVTDAEGIISGSSENVVFTQNARLNVLQSEAKAGDCQNPVFQNAWNDSTMKDAESVNEGLVAKEKAGVEAVDGKHTWVTQGVFKTEDGTKCLILKFSLKNSVDSEDVLKTDKDLESRLAFELGLTQRDGVAQ